MPLSETQNGEVAPYEIPHALTRWGSVIWAGLAPWSLVTRFVTAKLSARARAPILPGSPDSGSLGTEAAFGV